MSERITVFDIEVLNADPSSICSIGIVVLEDGEIVDEFYSLIRPRTMIFDKYRYRVHQIRPDMLYNENTFKQTWPKISHYFENQIVVSHDIQTDMSCLRAALKRNHIAYPTLKMSCTYVLAHMFYPDLGKYNITDLCESFQIPFENAHHALYDAYACAGVLNYILKDQHFKTLQELHETCHLAFGEMKVNYYRNIISPDLAMPITENYTHPLANHSFAFTGKFQTPKSEMTLLAKKIHAYVSHDVNTHTNFLVIGRIGYTNVRYGGANKKVNKAKQLIEYGQDLRIISETDYLNLIKKS